jgi:hypothetical protein
VEPSWRQRLSYPRHSGRNHSDPSILVLHMVIRKRSHVMDIGKNRQQPVLRGVGAGVI